MTPMPPEDGRADARTVSHRRVFTGRMLALDVDDVEEPGGVRGVREVVRHPGSVAALPVHEDGRVVLVRQYRYPVGREVWELPAGKLDGGESPEEGARRELEEETGLRASALEPISVFYTTPGFCDEVMHVFRATELTSVPPRPEDDERIEVGTFTLNEARAMIRAGEVREGKTLVALLFEVERRSRGSADADRGAAATLPPRRPTRP
jgi:ADP-ribose pyrophosphatase